MQTYLEAASTHNNAKTHAGTVFVPHDLLTPTLDPSAETLCRDPMRRKGGKMVGVCECMHDV